jgi:hypothetical protein
MSMSILGTNERGGRWPHQGLVLKRFTEVHNLLGFLNFHAVCLVETLFGRKSIICIVHFFLEDADP